MSYIVNTKWQKNKQFYFQKEHIKQLLTTIYYRYVIFHLL